MPGADPQRQLKIARAHGREAAHDVLGKPLLQGRAAGLRHHAYGGRFRRRRHLRRGSCAAGEADAEADAAGVDRGYRRGKHGMVVPLGKTMSSAGGAAGGKKSPTGVPRTSCASGSPTARGPACHIWLSCLTALRCSSWGPACRRPSSTRSSHSCSRQGHELGLSLIHI